MATPARITDLLWKSAAKLLSRGQVAIVIAVDGRTSMVRSNLAGGMTVLVKVLRELADKIEEDGLRQALDDFPGVAAEQGAGEAAGLDPPKLQ